MFRRFAPVLCAVTISFVPVARAEAGKPAEACTVQLGPTTGLHAAPSGSVRRVMAMEPLGTGRLRPDCAAVVQRRA